VIVTSGGRNDPSPVKRSSEWVSVIKGMQYDRLSERQLRFLLHLCCELCLQRVRHCGQSSPIRTL